MRQDSPDSSIGGIDFQDKLLEVNKNRSLGELSLELEEGFICLRGPGEEDLSGSEDGERCGCLTLVLNETVEVGKAKKSL